MDVVVRTVGGEAEVAVEFGDDPDVTIGDLAGAFRGRPSSMVAVDGRILTAPTRMAHAGLRRGGIIDLDPRPARPSAPTAGDGADDAVVEVVTIAGAGVGRRRRLAPGRYHVGPGRGDHDLADGIVSDVRWRLHVPTLDEVTDIHVVELDDRVVELRPAAHEGRGEPTSPRGAVGADGTVACNRPPRRLDTGGDDETVAVPDREQDRGQRRPIPVVAMIAPVPMAVAMAMVLGNWRFALFGLLSPIMVIANLIEDRRAARRTTRRASRADRIAARDVARAVAELSARTAARRRHAHPHLAELITWMRDGHPRLWERRPTHPDAYRIPIGWGTEPWQPTLTSGRDAVTLPRLPDGLAGVPITIDLAHDTGLGLVGDRAGTRGVARAVVLAAAALHGPADLTVVVCATRGDGADTWEWVKWLPHCRGAGVRLHSDPAAPVDLPDSAPDHVVLVVADGERWWHGRHAPLRRSLTRPDLRIVAIADDERSVPATATVTIRVASVGRADLVQVPTAAVTAGFALNRVDLGIAVAAARHLARLDDPEVAATETNAADDLPGVRVLDLLDLAPPTAAAVCTRWATAGRRIATPLGTGRHGPVSIDLVADGPHALIAGTTGAGKSELLRTLVVGLAATQPPSALNFVLIDFKGGAAFDTCARLPHTVGMVTDLDEHLAARMLRSLRAEVTRRERHLRDRGVGSLDELPPRPDAVELARLIIVVDEFASLAAQLPDFVPGLVDIAQRGRSLGVHLVLATQRPAGVVDNKIRANTNLRIALRVHDDADSFDVIGTRDATTLPRHRPGRAIVRYGAGELVEVQTALATGPDPSVGSSSSPSSPGLTIGFRPFVVARPLSSDERRLDAIDAATTTSPVNDNDLDRLVDAIRSAAGRVDLDPPCRDPLPPAVGLDDIPSHADPDGPGLPLALVDRPDEQRWSVRTWAPGPGRSLGLVGMVGSGTTSALVHLALALTSDRSPDACHLYIVDADTGRLRVLDRLPHVGAVVGVDDPARVARLVAVVGSEVERRRSAVETADVAGGRPDVVLMIDNLAAMGDALERDRAWRDVWPAFERVVRDGPAVGVTLVVTASHERGLPPAVTAHLGERLVLRLPDRSAFAAFGLRPADVPDLGPGRAIDPTTGWEHQLFAPPADLAAAVEEVGERWPAALVRLGRSPHSRRR